MTALCQAPARILCRAARLQYDRAVSRILITGASGFVGRALLPVLAPRHRLVLAQRRAGGQSAIAGAEHRLVGDIGPETDWSAALRGIDAVVHLAAYVHVDDARAD